MSRTGQSSTVQRPTTQNAQSILEIDDENADAATAGGLEEDFTQFRFKSFRTHKLIEEDYSLL
jgi:hypothetical protein